MMKYRRFTLKERIQIRLIHLVLLILLAEAALVYGVRICRAGEQPVEILKDADLTANEIIDKYHLVFNGLEEQNSVHYTLQGSYPPGDSGIFVNYEKMDVPGVWGVEIGTKDFSVFGLTVGSLPEEVEEIYNHTKVIRSNRQSTNGMPEYLYFATYDWALNAEYENGVVSTLYYSVLEPGWEKKPPME